MSAVLDATNAYAAEKVDNPMLLKGDGGKGSVPQWLLEAPSLEWTGSKPVKGKGPLGVVVARRDVSGGGGTLADPWGYGVVITLSGNPEEAQISTKVACCEAVKGKMKSFQVGEVKVWDEVRKLTPEERDKIAADNASGMCCMTKLNLHDGWDCCVQGKDWPGREASSEFDRFS